MLWPDGVTVTISSGDGYSTRTTRFGFTDVTGTLVVKPRYESFTYCADAAGRLAWVIGTGAGRKADVLDLTGTVVVTAPAKDAACGTPGTVIFSHWFDAELGHHRDGLLDIASGKVLLPMVPDRHINLVDATTLNVSEPGGEYFLTPRTGARTPHAGWLAPDTGLEAGAPGLPAYQTRPTDDGSGPDPRLGFVGRTGNWVATPAFQDASGFVKGHAVVALGDGHVTFVDTRLQRVGGEWSSIETVVAQEPTNGELVGYLVESEAGQALLGTDLRPIVPLGRAKIACDWSAGGACSVVGADHRASLVLLPQGTITAMPEGFTMAVSGSFVASPVGGNDAMGRVMALDSGTVTMLEAPSRCVPDGTDWVTCTPNDSEVLPPVVLDAQGNRTPFADVQPMYDPVPGAGVAYYWAATGRYQGFIDAHGTWLYRHGRFTQLED